jgi:hypothetical protein
MHGGDVGVTGRAISFMDYRLTGIERRAPVSAAG